MLLLLLTATFLLQFSFLNIYCLLFLSHCDLKPLFIILFISDLNPNNPLFSASMVSDERMYLGLKAMDTVHDLKSSGSTVKDEEITKYYHSCRQ